MANAICSSVPDMLRDYGCQIKAVSLTDQHSKELIYSFIKGFLIRSYSPVGGIHHQVNTAGIL